MQALFDKSSTNFGLRLRSYIESHGTVEDAYRQLAVSRATLFNWFQRDRPPPGRSMQEKLRLYLDSEADWVMFGREAAAAGVVTSVQEAPAFYYSQGELAGFAERMQFAVAESQLPLVTLAERIGVRMDRMEDWFNGRGVPRAAEARRLASVLDVREKWLRFGEMPKRDEDGGEMSEAVRAVPVISWSHAGEAATYEEMPKHWQGSVATTSRDRKAFAVIVEGDCMEPKFLPGDRVVLEPHAELRNGKPVVAKLVDDAVQLRIYTKLPSGAIRLASLKPEIYPTIDYKLADIHWIYPVRELVRSV